MAKFCSECGSSLPENAKFCNTCGTPCEEFVHPVLQDESVTIPLQEEPTAEAPFLQPGVAQPPYQQPTYQPLQAPQPTYQPISQPRPQPVYATPTVPQTQAEYVAPGTPDTKKSHLALGIIITVVTLLFIAGIVVFFILDPFHWFGGRSPQDLMDQDDKLYYNTDDFDVDAYMSLYYGDNFYLTDEEKADLREYYIDEQKSDREYYKEEYGDDVTFSTKVGDYMTLSSDEMDRAIEYYSDPPEGFDRVKIEEIRRAEVSYTITGSLDSYDTTATVDFVKVDGKWYIGRWSPDY